MKSQNNYLINSKILIMLLGLSLLIVVGSCAQKECTEIAIVNVRVAFYNADNPKEQAVVDTLSVVGLNENNQPIDTLLYDKKKALSHVLLPLRGNSEETRYLFTYYLENDVQETDTLVLRHDNRPYVISPECGCVVFHTLQSFDATKRLIRDSQIVNSQITNKDEIHIILRY